MSCRRLLQMQQSLVTSTFMLPFAQHAHSHCQTPLHLLKWSSCSEGSPALGILSVLSACEGPLQDQRFRRGTCSTIESDSVVTKTNGNCPGKVRSAPDGERLLQKWHKAMSSPSSDRWKVSSAVMQVR